jgi:hypothetical protein
MNMNNDNLATINGLMDGISILENNKKEPPYLPEDILYNDQEVGLEGVFHEAENILLSDFDYSSYYEGLNLISTGSETFFTSAFNSLE